MNYKCTRSFTSIDGVKHYTQGDIITAEHRNRLRYIEQQNFVLCTQPVQPVVNSVWESTPILALNELLTPVYDTPHNDLTPTDFGRGDFDGAGADF